MSTDTAQRNPVKQDDLQKRIHDLAHQKIAFSWKGMKKEEAEIDREINDLLKQRVLASTPKPVQAQKPVEKALAVKSIEVEPRETVVASMKNGKAGYHHDEIPNLFLKQVTVPKYA
jgi:hypothetical protein